MVTQAEELITPNQNSDVIYQLPAPASALAMPKTTKITRFEQKNLFTKILKTQTRSKSGTQATKWFLGWRQCLGKRVPRKTIKNCYFLTFLISTFKVLWKKTV